MAVVRTRMIFISHAWKYEEHYRKLVEWFNKEPYFPWKNCSVPSHDQCSETTERGLKECLTKQIRPANVVIILGGMYSTYSEWINYEIGEAARMEKPIIGVKPWGQERMPQIIQEISDRVVGWNRESIINAIKDLS